MTAPTYPPDLPPAPVTDHPVGVDRSAEWKAAGLIVGVLAAVGAILGLVWTAWSPPGPLGVVLTGGIQADETEAFVAGDARFAVLTLSVGLIAGIAAWFLRPVRGPVVAIALAVGGLIGAGLTDLVGWAVRGDRDDAKVGTLIQHLPLTVHMHALWLTEAALAALVYSLFVAFAADDDLGRPDPRRAGAVPTPVPMAVPVPGYWAPSVQPEGGLQDGRRDGDGAGPPQ